MTQDQGNRFVRDGPEAAPLIFLHHWGAPRSVRRRRRSASTMRRATTSRRPRHHGAALPRRAGAAQPVARRRSATRRTARRRAPGARLGAPAVSAAIARDQLRDDFSRTSTLFFSGKMNLNWGRAYALGVRQAVFRAHRHQKGFLIMTFDNGVQEKTPFETPRRQLRRAPSSASRRRATASRRGSTSACSSAASRSSSRTTVEMAFEDVLPWHRFSLRAQLLGHPAAAAAARARAAAAVARMRRGLGCIWPRMLWLARASTCRRRSTTTPSCARRAASTPSRRR